MNDGGLRPQNKEALTWNTLKLAVEKQAFCENGERQEKIEDRRRLHKEIVDGRRRN